MWANDRRLASSWSHLWTLRPKPIVVPSTRRLCHITPRASGTWPSSFRLNRLMRYPYGPVLSAGGIRGVLDIGPPGVDVRHEDTGRPPSVTAGYRPLGRRGTTMASRLTGQRFERVEDDRF